MVYVSIGACVYVCVLVKTLIKEKEAISLKVEGTGKDLEGGAWEELEGIK